MTRVVFWLVVAPLSAGFEWPGRINQHINRLHSSNATERREACEEVSSIDTERIRTALLQLLQDANDEVRVCAARTLARSRVKEAIAPLGDWLSDPARRSRTAAAEALGDMATAEAAPALLRALGDSDAEIRRSAVVSLSRLRRYMPTAPLLEAISGKLADDQIRVREAAVEALHALADARAVVPLLGCLSDSSRQVRAAAAAALGSLGDLRAVPALLRSLADAQEVVRTAAIDALGTLRAAAATSRLVELSVQGPAPQRNAALRALGLIGGPQAARALTQALRESSTRKTAISALTRSVAESVDFIDALLRDSTTDASTLEAAVVAAGEISDARLSGGLQQVLAQGRVRPELVLAALASSGDAPAVAAILPWTKHESAAVRKTALAALAARADQRATPAVLDATHDPDSAVRLQAVAALGQLKSPSASPRLQELLFDPDPRMGVAAAHALAPLQDAAAIEALLSAIEHGAKGVPQTAAIALARVGNRQVVARLLRLAGRPDRQRAAALALMGIARRVPFDQRILDFGRSLMRAAAAGAPGAPGVSGDRVMGALLAATAARRSPRVAEGLAKTLIAELSQSPQRLLPIAGEPGEAFQARGAAPGADANNRRLLADLLTITRGKIAVEQAVRLTGDRDPRVRAHALWALLRLDPQTAALVAETALRDVEPAVRAAAIAALVKPANDAARARTAKPLRESLSDEDAVVRANACRAVAQRRDRESVPLVTELVRRDVNEFVVRACAQGLKLLGSIDAASAGPAAQDWLTVSLEDDSGVPLSHARYVIELPGGMLRTGWTNAAGLVHEEGIAPGECRWIEPLVSGER